jgi:hypothetical protein
MRLRVGTLRQMIPKAVAAKLLEVVTRDLDGFYAGNGEARRRAVRCAAFSRME